MISTMTDWLLKRPKWLQVAAKQLLELGELNDAAIGALAVLCQQEANKEFPDINYNIPTGAFSVCDLQEIRLCSISEIAGVNKLGGKNPLEFGKSNLAVIYGCNGSGKSGYVRLLKHICGARDCILGKLHKNVFLTEDIAQKAKISYYKNSSSDLESRVKENYKWSGHDICNDLSSIEVFDTSFGRVFVGSENEVSYEPPILLFLSRLIDVCEKVSEVLNVNAEALKSIMPNIPNNLLASAGADWLQNISAKTLISEIETQCLFPPESETELLNLQKRILEQSPAHKAKQLQNKKEYTDKIIGNIQIILNQHSDENYKNIIALKEDVILKKSVAEMAAKKAFNAAQLEGIGSDIWKELWDTARKYSVESAYKDQEFPVVCDGSVCVLCHQALSEDAKQRLKSFESYVKGDTEKQVNLAEENLKQAVDRLPDIIKIEALKAQIDAAGIEEQDVIKDLSNIITTFQERRTKLLSFDFKNSSIVFDKALHCLKGVQEISKEYEDNANKYSQDATKDNQEELQKKLKDLQVKKWLSEQKTTINKEVLRLKSYEKIQNAKKTTSSTALSKKKGQLAEELITDAFVKRFNAELNLLGASRIKVKLIKTRVSKGKVLHSLQLDGANNSLDEVLSEGENRIVSIAAFLADVTGKNYLAPLVFDDPISSLDLNYEEAVVQRLCSIASNRQVIIFTHRLPLVSMIQDYGKKLSIVPEIVCIRAEPWGTGEPGDTPLHVKKPLAALNTLIDVELPKIKKLFNESGFDAYKSDAKFLCSEFRILLERMVEYELMSDVVQRYRRSITTQNKMCNLAKISESDCEYFDALMTKYSRYEHSQSLEAPVSLPEPEEFERDFNKLKEWQAEFKTRL